MKYFQRLMILQWIFLLLSIPALGNSTNYSTTSQSTGYILSAGDEELIIDQYLPGSSQDLLIDLIDSSEEEEEKIHKKLKNRSPQFNATELLAKKITLCLRCDFYNLKRFLYYSCQNKPKVDRCIAFQVLRI